MILMSSAELSRAFINWGLSSFGILSWIVVPGEVSNRVTSFEFSNVGVLFYLPSADIGSNILRLLMKIP